MSTQYTQEVVEEAKAHVDDIVANAVPTNLSDKIGELQINVHVNTSCLLESFIPHTGGRQIICAEYLVWKYAS